jgi:nicotinate-nucleotide adenylyltransferase
LLIVDYFYQTGGRLSQKIGILGGTFNPIHYGHLAAAEEVWSRLKLDQVLFVPSFLPPHKQDEVLPSAAQRQEMVSLAIAGNAHFSLSDIEVKREGKSYSVDTVAELMRLHPATDFYFITGLDSFLEIQTWKEWERLLSFCRFIVLSRPGYAFAGLASIDFMHKASEKLRALDQRELTRVVLEFGRNMVYLEQIPLYDISSTDIRKRVRQGCTIKYLLPECVETYIIKNNLYG